MRSALVRSPRSSPCRASRGHAGARASRVRTVFAGFAPRCSGARPAFPPGRRWSGRGVRCGRSSARRPPSPCARGSTVTTGCSRFAAIRAPARSRSRSEPRRTSLPAGGGDIRVRDVERWWPHTHGEPHLYRVQLRTEAGELERAVGFRELEWPSDLEQDGLCLRVNGVSVFVRGAVWTPVAGPGAAKHDRPAARRRDEPDSRRRDDRLRVSGIPRSLRRAGDARLAGPDVRQHGLPVLRSGLPRARRCGDPAGARAGRGQAEPGRRLRQQRGRAAGGNARSRSGARPQRAVRRRDPAPGVRGGDRRRIRSVGADRRRAAVSHRSRSCELLRCRCVPAGRSRMCGAPTSGSPRSVSPSRTCRTRSRPPTPRV